MPSKSPTQARLMQAVAHNKGVAKKIGTPQNVGREFAAADAAKGTEMKAKGYGMARGAKRTQKFAEGGETGRFDEDTYARARKFVDSDEDGEKVAEPMRMNKLEGKPLPAAKAATKKPAAKTSTKSESKADSEDKPKSFSRLSGPSEGSRADKALKTYKPPTDDQYAGLKEAGKAAALAAAPAGLGAAARGMKSAAEGVKRIADIPRQAGQRFGGAMSGRNSPFPSMTDDVGSAMASDVSAMRRGVQPTGRGAAKAAQRTAGVRAGSRMAGRTAAVGASAEAGEKVGTSISNRMEKGREARRKESEDMKCGGKVKGYAKGGSIRGGGIEQRGKTKGATR